MILLKVNVSWMSGKQVVNVSEGICFRLANVVSLQRQSEQTGLQISLNWRWLNFSINLLNVLNYE